MWYRHWVGTARRLVSWQGCPPKGASLSQLAFIAAFGVLAPACVSGTIAGDSHRDTGGSAQAGSGAQGSAGQGGSSSGPPPATSIPAESACGSAPSPGPRVLRRLTAKEFASSIADVFGDKTVPVSAVFNDSRVLGFTVDSSLQVKDLNADQLMTNAESVAGWAVSQAQLPRLTQLANCSTHDQACAKAFVKAFGRKAFRMPVPDARVDAYSALFMADGTTTFADGASSVIAAMLQSPYFLYRSELGAEGASGATVPLTAYEVASSLSYLLTGSTPDDTLLSAAESLQGSNATALANMVEAQAQRLLGPSGAGSLPAPAQDAVMNFMSGWLGLDRLYTNVKDTTQQELTDAQRADMAAETKKFILDIFSGSTNNAVGNLFDRPTSNPLDSGILGQKSILIGYARSNGSSPTQRGHLVRSRLLCQDVPPPPDGLDVKFTENAQFKTTREQYLNSHAAPGRQPCYGCHQMMDPIGVAFEHYDAFGNYRTEENGVPIDATGTIYSASATDGTVTIDGLSGPQGLQTYLAQSDEVKKCLVRYWSYYAFGSASWAQDGCTYDAIRAEASAQSYSLKSVLMAILHTPRFTTRVNDQ